MPCNTIIDVFVRLFRTTAEANSCGIVQIHNNASPHTARHTHTPCCMMNFIGTHLTILPTVWTWHQQAFTSFLKMKEHLAGKRFTDEKDLQHAVVEWLNREVAVWYEEGISKLVSRYDKCLNVQGDWRSR
jgi:hypothetical protein